MVLKFFNVVTIDRYGFLPLPLESGLCDGLTNKIQEKVTCQFLGLALRNWQLLLPLS